MPGFVKLDCSIVYSSIWSESSEACKVWITMLAMANQNGVVPATAPGISSASFISLSETRKAIALLEAPDPDSKSLDHEGRRIERVEGGYLILNYNKYRAFNYSLKDEAIYMREYREKKKKEAELKKSKSYNVITKSLHSVSVSASASEILNYLNLKTGKKYRNTKEILARLASGYKVDDFKKIIDTKILDPYFLENPHYLNPVTLFRKSHFDNYLNQSPEDFKGNGKNGKGFPAIIIIDPIWEKEHHYDSWMSVKNDGRGKIVEMVALYQANESKLSSADKKTLAEWVEQLGEK